jgi:hypothetical protein
VRWLWSLSVCLRFRGWRTDIEFSMQFYFFFATNFIRNAFEIILPDLDIWFRFWMIHVTICLSTRRRSLGHSRLSSGGFALFSRSKVFTICARLNHVQVEGKGGSFECSREFESLHPKYNDICPLSHRPLAYLPPCSTTLSWTLCSSLTTKWPEVAPYAAPAIHSAFSRAVPVTAGAYPPET